MFTPARALLRLFLAVGLVAGCGAGADTTDSVLAIDTPTDAPDLVWAMAAGVAGDGSHLGDAVVIVPSDDALLSLDADALADLVATDRLRGMIDDAVIRAGFGTAVEPGDTYLLTNGDSVFVTEAAGQLLLNEHRLLETTTVGEATVLVVDGVVVTP